MTVVNEAHLRGVLTELLQEADSGRKLDSLESVVVLAYLRHAGLVDDDFAGENRPDTVDGWLAWVAQR